MTADTKLQQLHALCEVTNTAWHKWFHMLPCHEKTIARLHYLAALNKERMLYDVIMQEDSGNTQPDSNHAAEDDPNDNVT